MKDFYSLISPLGQFKFLIPQILLMMFLVIFSLVAHQSIAIAGSGPVILLHASQVEMAVLSEVHKAIEDEGYTVFPYEEPHLFTVSLQECGAFIASAVNEVAGLFPDEKIRIAAVCNGGVASQYFLKNYPEEAAMVSHFVNFTSSNRGTELAPVGVLLNMIPGYSNSIGLLSAEAISLMNEKFFYPTASEEEYKAGLPGITKEVVIDKCSDNLGWFPCYAFFNWKLPLKLKTFFLVFGYDSSLIDSDYDDVLRTIMLELYVADNYLRYAGNDGGYDIDPTVPIYQVEHPSNPEMISLRETPLPEHIIATSIYSCMDYSVKPYSNGFLDGATNVVVCRDGNHTPTKDHPFDEIINEVSFHWSAYYQPFIIDRIVKGLE